MSVADPLDVLLLTRDGGAVQRYHTRRIRPQSVAEHSYGVAQIILYARTGRTASASLLRAALNHDVYEFITGDTPATAKWSYPRLKEALDIVEVDIDRQYLLMPLLPVEDDALLKWADLAELTMYGLEQLKSGNQYAWEIVVNGGSAMKKLNPFLSTDDTDGVTSLLLYITTETNLWTR